jgi:hypothetical protein
MTMAADYVDVVYGGDAASVLAFGYEFKKGVRVTAPKPVADRLLDAEQFRGFALYEPPQPKEPEPAPAETEQKEG